MDFIQNIAMDWGPVQGVPRLLPEVSWDWFQLPPRTTMDKRFRKQIDKWTDFEDNRQVMGGKLHMVKLHLSWPNSVAVALI